MRMRCLLVVALVGVAGCGGSGGTSKPALDQKLLQAYERPLIDMARHATGIPAGVNVSSLIATMFKDVRIRRVKRSGSVATAEIVRSDHTVTQVRFELIDGRWRLAEKPWSVIIGVNVNGT